MFSHGALMQGIVDEPLPMAGHALRFAAQASVLSVLLTLSESLPSRDGTIAGDDRSSQGAARARD